MIHAAAPTADSTDIPGWHGPTFYSVFYALQTKLPPELSLFPQKVARQQRSGGGQPENVIKGCKNHQHHDDRQPDPEPDFLGPLRQRPAANRLDRVEQKVTAIEQRYREQVQEANRDREHGCEMDQGRKASRRHLAGNLRDPYRPTELIGRLPSNKDAANVGKGSVDHEPGLLRPHDDGAQWPRLLRFDVTRRHRSAYAKHAKTVNVAKVVFKLL